MNPSSQVARFSTLVVAGILGTAVAAQVFTAASFEANASALKDRDKKSKSSEKASKKEAEKAAEARFEKLKARWDKASGHRIEQRILLLDRFRTAPCEKTVRFLTKLYSDESNSGIHMTVTKVLGSIGSEKAIQGVLLKGVPLIAGDEFYGTAIADALESKLSAKAETFVVRKGLRIPELKKFPQTWNRILKAVAGYRTPLRVAALTQELLRGDDATMIVILSSLEDTHDKKLVTAATRLLRHKNPEVQAAAMNLLHAQGGKKQRKLFEKGVKSKHWQIRLLSLRTLARIKHKKIVDYATKGLDDKDARVQIIAIKILLEKGGKDVVLPLIEKLDSSEGRVKDDLIDALTRLTGKDLPPSTFQWKGWWEQKGRKIKTIERCSAEEFAAMKQELEAGAKTVSYHGLRILSDNFAFLIDSSESMKEEYVPPVERPKTGSRKTTVKKPGDVNRSPRKAKIAVAKEQLVKVINGLKAGKRFDIIRFESVITDFIRDGLGLQTKELIKLDEAVRQNAVKFVQASQPQGQTYMLKALETAFSNENVDTIYLLSDGAPPPPETAGMDVILEKMKKLNRTRCVKINTIGFDLQPKEREFLIRLADEHFGVFIER